jgi:excisionase family DNA binding protein
MTVSEMCEFLRCRPTTLYRLIKKRHIPFLRIGSDYRFNRDTIEVWLHAQEKAPASSNRSGRGRGCPRP